jgi:hypothetical protein
MTSRTPASPDAAGDRWFDDAQIIDEDWIELSLTTPGGEHVRYRIPRRTHFDTVDNAVDHLLA